MFARRTDVLRIMALVFACAPGLQAQTKTQTKTTVAVLPVSTTRSTDVERYGATAFEGLLTSSLGALGRISVLDRTQADRISAERETQKGVDFIDSRTLAAQGQSLGALLVLTANVDKIALTQNRLEDGTIDHQANITVTVRIIDVGTQEVKTSAVLSADAASGGKKGLSGLVRSLTTVHSTAEDAITAAVKNLSGGLDGFYRDAFPVRFIIAQVESMRPDSTQGTFLIDGGKNIGARTKMQLTVVELTEVQVGSRTVKRERELGILEISRLDGEELAIGTMKTGAREVAALLSAGKKVQAFQR
jgi:hypothetical protein